MNVTFCAWHKMLHFWKKLLRSEIWVEKFLKKEGLLSLFVEYIFSIKHKIIIYNKAEELIWK